MTPTPSRRTRNSALAGLSPITHDPSGTPLTTSDIGDTGEPGDTGNSRNASDTGNPGNTEEPCRARTDEPVTKITVQLPSELAARARGAYLRDGAGRGESFSTWVANAIRDRITAIEIASGTTVAQVETLPRGPLPFPQL